MALSIADLTVGIDTSSITEFRREIETTFVRTIETRALPALEALRKLLMSAVRAAVRTVASVIKTRLLRQLMAMNQWLRMTSRPVLLIARLLRSYLIPALLALARDAAYASAVLAFTMATAAVTIAGWLTVLTVGFTMLTVTVVTSMATMVLTVATAVGIITSWLIVLTVSITTLTTVLLASAAAMVLAWQQAMAPIPLFAAAILQLTATILLAWQQILVNTMVTWTAITVAIQTALMVITTSILTAWQTIFANTVVAFTTLWTFLQVIWATIVLTIATATAMIYANIAATWQSVVAITIAAFTQILIVVPALLAALLTFIALYMSAIIESFQTLRVLPQLMQEIFTQVYLVVFVLLGLLAAAVRTFTGQIVGDLNQIRDAISQVGDEALDASWKIGVFIVAIAALALALEIAAPFLETGAAAIQSVADAIQSLVDAIEAAGSMIGDFFDWVGGLFSASTTFAAGAVTTPALDTGTANLTTADASVGARPVIWIENFHATAAQTPADIAAELDWISRGGG